MLYLHPVDGHPEGPKEEIWFVLIHDELFPINALPLGARGRPWYRRVNELIYPMPEHPEVPPPHEAPHFRIHEHFCIPHEGHPHGPSDTPWYKFIDSHGKPGRP